MVVALLPWAMALSLLSGALAFQPAPVATRLWTGASPGRHRHGAYTLMAAAEGHDEWFIDEEDSTTSEGPVANRQNDDEIDDVRRYFATCVPGLQATLASELIGLGASHVETQGKSGVRFEGSPKVGMKALLWCRT
ncbi:hypothetical protein ACHAXT_006298 [Thalassiosira profunda]